MTSLVTQGQPPPRRITRAGDFWLNLLFWQARNAPIVGTILKPLAMHLGWRCSEHVRDVTTHNARRIFGPNISRRQTQAYATGVMSNFVDFISEVGRCVGLTDQKLREQVESVSGQEAYDAARAAGKGAIIATAHMGSFEAAAAALLQREKKVHVVFKRDDMSRFEQVRSELRKRLGVIEAPIDDGWTVWLRLRDALIRNEVVMLQADRVMPKQKGCPLPFLHGHLELPTGPIKLALASGAPIIPIFAVRTKTGRMHINVEPAIFVEPSEERIHPALLQLAGILEKYVRAYPKQWLLMHRAFCEDAPPAKSQEGAA